MSRGVRLQIHTRTHTPTYYLRRIYNNIMYKCYYVLLNCCIISYYVSRMADIFFHPFFPSAVWYPYLCILIIYIYISYNNISYNISVLSSPPPSLFPHNARAHNFVFIFLNAPRVCIIYKRPKGLFGHTFNDVVPALFLTQVVWFQTLKTSVVAGVV